MSEAFNKQMNVSTFIDRLQGVVRGNPSQWNEWDKHYKLVINILGPEIDLGNWGNQSGLLFIWKALLPFEKPFI